MKTVNTVFATAMAIMTVLSIYMAFNFFVEAKTSSYQEQTTICLVLSVVSFLLFVQINKFNKTK